MALAGIAQDTILLTIKTTSLCARYMVIRVATVTVLANQVNLLTKLPVK